MVGVKVYGCGELRARNAPPNNGMQPTPPGTVTVAGKPSLDVPPGTLNAILKQGGLKKDGSSE